MNHPFGELLTQHLERGKLTQSALAEGTNIPASVISRMIKGKRLTGQTARDRVLEIIHFLHKINALDSLNEADALLEAAGMARLNPENGEGESQLYRELWVPTSATSATSFVASESQDLLVADEAVSELGLNGKRLVWKWVERLCQRRILWLVGVLLVGLLFFGGVLQIGQTYRYPGWAVHIEEVDDANLVLVDGKIVHVHSVWHDKEPLISLEPFLADNASSRVTLVNLNGYGIGKCTFTLQYEGVTQWEKFCVESGREYTATVIGEFEIMSGSDRFVPVDAPSLFVHEDIKPVLVDVVRVKEYVLVLVNGRVAGGVFETRRGVFPPINIQPHLHPTETNRVEFLFWGLEGLAPWHVEISRGGETITSFVNLVNRNVEMGVFHREVFFMTADGELVLEEGR